MKIDAAKVRDLSQLQAMHQRCFQAAYTAEPTRPKAHYARHLTAQVTKWKRHLDGFVGERKHKVFKSVIGPKNNNLQNFTKSCLLQLTEYNLQHGERLERMTGQLIGKPKPNATLALRAPSWRHESFSWTRILLHEVPTWKFRPNHKHQVCRSVRKPF